MRYFEKFTSNTCAASSNQLFFSTEGKICSGRTFYKISQGGEYNYSLLFSNIIDSTFADGNLSHKNLVCDEWEIHGARIGRCKFFDPSRPLCELVMRDEGESDIEAFDFKDITFDGKSTKRVSPGEFFSSDEQKFFFEKDEYLCLEMTFSGRMIPYHEESMLPVYVKDGDKWRYSKLMPFAGMIGCDRNVKARVAYIGDSITQGIGTKENAYLHWNALLSEHLGGEYAYWNLGLGYARAYDASSDGAWLFKARQNDVVFVCFGVNDILRGRCADKVKADLTYIVDTLKNKGARVIVQTVPPFDYQGSFIDEWNKVNHYILNELCDKADFVFDNTPILGKPEKLSDSLYGAHPDERGCKLWAEALYEKLKQNSVL